MKKIDWIFGYTIFGFILFITCFCAGWWLDIAVGGNGIIGCAAGAAAGVVTDILFLKRIVSHMYSLNPWVLAIVFLLYSVGIFGFFMGVPVMNAALGVVAGWYVGRRAKVASESRYKAPLARAVWFSTAVLVAFCTAAAWLALRDPTTAANLEGMLCLGFHMTTGMIWGIILIGGAGLLAVQAGTAALSARLAYKLPAQANI